MEKNQSYHIKSETPLLLAQYRKHSGSWELLRTAGAARNGLFSEIYTTLDERSRRLLTLNWPQRSDFYVKQHISVRRYQVANVESLAEQILKRRPQVTPSVVDAAVSIATHSLNTLHTHVNVQQQSPPQSIIGYLARLRAYRDEKALHEVHSAIVDALGGHYHDWSKWLETRCSTHHRTGTISILHGAPGIGQIYSSPSGSLQLLAGEDFRPGDGAEDIGYLIGELYELAVSVGSSELWTLAHRHIIAQSDQYDKRDMLMSAASRALLHAFDAAKLAGLSNCGALNGQIANQILSTGL